MIWASNYTRLAVQTVNTLFWAGREFAPKCIIDGVNIQDWLQDHYLASVQELAKAIATAGDLLDSCVIGWDSLNEPNEGFVGMEDINKHAAEGAAILRIGPTPTAFQAMRLGMGEKLKVENWKFSSIGPKRDGDVVIDPKGRKAWLDPESEPEGKSRWGWQRDPGWQLGKCIWALHGVWDVQSKQVLRSHYFAHPTADIKEKTPRLSFSASFWKPHWREYSRRIRAIHKEAILFCLTPVFQVPPSFQEPEDVELLSKRACHSVHFYDGLTLVTKHWVSISHTLLQ